MKNKFPPILPWSLLVFNIIIAIFIYLFREWHRTNADDFWLDAGLGAGFIILTAIPIVYGVGLLLLICAILAIMIVFRNKNFLSLLSFGLIIGALFFPMPPSPPTIEETLFLSHQADYEYLVELSETNQLQHSNECKFYRYTVPKGYEQLTEDCVYVEKIGVFHTVASMEFTPRSFYRPIVYFKDSETMKTSGPSPCWGDGGVFRQMNEHWYICKRDFN